MAVRGRRAVETNGMAKRSRFPSCGCNGLKDSLHAARRGGFYGVLAAEDTGGWRGAGGDTAGSLSAADEWAR